ncbi:AlpA family transcriptional regulator [uncultured Pseudoalteromonas sp.]|uniref:helix-turn-helix transcriptional regulator n=1 Tax=Pseudoalteromonas TaxID=53246 RepID=UPI0030DB1885|tara:strand:+ start:7671 stop:7871 length:201 start_codon:yes stop_codon:yes gene_type:complete
MIDRILKQREVVKITGMSRPTIWRKEKLGLFPARRDLGARSVGWLESEIKAWMESLPCVKHDEEAA